VRVSIPVSSHFRIWQSGVAALLCLVPLILMACGATTAKPTGRVISDEPSPTLTPLPRSIHAPPGFSLSGCPVTTVPNGSLCFTRPTSVVLTRPIFAQIVRAAGVTISTSHVFCQPRIPAKKPRAPYILNCRVQGVSGQTHVFVIGLSLVMATGLSFSTATRDLPMRLRGTNHGAPIIIEFINFGPTTGTN
jgi:hypothetical protein